MKSLNSLWWTAGAALALGASFVSHVHGAPLATGSVLIPSSAEFDPVGGTVLSTLTVPFVAPGAFSGTLTTEVISGDTTNTLGGLTFTYLITNDAGGTNSIGRMSVVDYDGFATDGNYQVPAGGVAPASIDRNVSGDVIGFNFVPTPLDPSTGFLTPGLSSALLVIQTDAPAFRESFANFIDGGVATTGTLAPVPEPGTMILVLSALVTMGGFRLRRL